MDRTNIPPEKLDNYESLKEIAEWLELDVPFRTFENWAAKRDKNGFPEPLELGRYRLYDKYEVEAWTKLWFKVSKGMKWKEVNAR